MDTTRDPKGNTMKSFTCDPLCTAKIDHANMNGDAMNGIPPEHALGFLACTPDLEYDEIHNSLAKNCPVPIIGGTALGNPFDTGTDPFISQFSVMGKKSMSRGIAVSDPLGSGDDKAVMRKLHDQCQTALKGDAKLFIIMMPLLEDLYADPFLDALFECAGQVPVFGGMLSDEFRPGRSALFANGSGHRDRVILAGFGGDIRPAFGTACEITLPSDHMPVVTACHGNVIMEVDYRPFTDYIKKIGLDDSAVSDFPAAVRVVPPGADPDAPMRVDALTAINAAEGSGRLSRTVQPGSAIGVGYITLQNIADSADLCLDRLALDMKRQGGDDYRYDLLFGVSCVARYYTLFEQEQVEAERIAGRFPDMRARFGYYGFSEICPFRNEDGTITNGKHGKSLALCAL